MLGAGTDNAARSRATVRAVRDAAPDAAADPAAFAADLGELASATDRLLAGVAGLTDDAARAPSRLPGWSRGHVLTHLARAADGLGNLAHWAATGQERAMYPSREARDAAIEAGAGRPAAELVQDVRQASARLAAALGRLGPESMARRVRLRTATALGGELPYLRLREVEIHHVDLDVGYTPAHWSPRFCVRTLDAITPLFRDRPMPVATLRAVPSGRTWVVADAGPELSGPESGLLAWLTGRSDGDGLLLDGADPAGRLARAPEWS